MTLHYDEGEDERERTLAFRFEFTGTAREYFSVWVVDVLLTALTLGLYSPWAKVRTKRYFYGHTWLDGAAFEYRGEPRVILARRLRVVVPGLLVGVAADLIAGSRVFIVGALLAIAGFAIYERLYDLRCSFYRGVRCDLERSRAEDEVFFLLPVLSMASVLLAFLYMGYRGMRPADRDRDGSADGDARPLPLLGELAGMAVAVFLLLLAGLSSTLLLVALVDHRSALAFLGQNPARPDWSWFVASFAAVMAFLLLPLAASFLYTGLWAYPRASLARLLATRALSSVRRLQSSVRPARFVGFEFVNAAAVGLSFGLLLPWTRIRRARYRLSRLALVRDSRATPVEDGGAFPLEREVVGVRPETSDRPSPVSVESGRSRAIRRLSWRLGLTGVLLALAVPAARYAILSPPRAVDDVIGAAMILEFLALFVAILLLPLALPVALALALMTLLKPHWIFRSEGDFWTMRAAASVVVWGLLVTNAPILQVIPGLPWVYAWMIVLLTAAFALDARTREREDSIFTRGRTRALLLGAAAALAAYYWFVSYSVVDRAAALSFVAIGTIACLVVPSRFRFRFSDACAGLLSLALLHQALVTLPGEHAAPDIHRVVLGSGSRRSWASVITARSEAYSFCEIPSTHRIYAAIPSCKGTNTASCQNDAIAEYDSRSFALRRRFAPFDSSFRGRMLHLVCLDDSLLVGMSFTSLDGAFRRENVMEVSTRDGAVLRRDVVGPGVGHRLLLRPDREDVFVVSEYSSVVRRYSLVDRNAPPIDIDLGVSGLQSWLSPFQGSLQTEVRAVRPSRGTGFFAEWVGGQRVSEVDLSSGQVVARYVVNDGGNHSLAVDDQYDHLVITSLWGIDMIDLRTGERIARQRTELGPRLPVIDPARGLIYVSTTFGNHVWVFDRKTLALKGKLVVGVGGHNSHLTSDGRYLLASGGGRHVAWDLNYYAREWMADR
jgi:uncharacterized membrane protein YjgN (DUF898 family)